MGPLILNSKAMRGELLAVVGLTCTGKATLALALADALGGPDAVSIIACDSTKVYRGADVGTAKLTGEARRGYEFLMVDVVDAGTLYSAGRYMTEGRAACEETWARGRLPLVVGGSGLYFRALVDGISEAPPADADVRAALAARRAAGEDLHERLREVDAEAAARISPADAKRITRALEVYELTGVPLAEIHSRGGTALEADRVAAVALDAPRRWLAPRVEERARRMFARGLRAETARLLAEVEDPTAPPLNAIGYRQAVQLLEGVLDEQTAFTDIVRGTLRLAKRQRTWFKKEKRATHLNAAEGPERLTEYVLGLWEALLQN
jgi:tRNA dimethylallyltransferase